MALSSKPWAGPRGHASHTYVRSDGLWVASLVLSGRTIRVIGEDATDVSREMLLTRRFCRFSMGVSRKPSGKKADAADDE